MNEESKIEEIFSKIKALCEQYHMTFAQVMCEAFFIFDDDFEQMDDDEALTYINNYMIAADRETGK